MRFGLIGEHLNHSFSKRVHSLIGEYDYELFEVASEELSSFLKKRDFRGVNVTIPYKRAVIPLLDHISDEAHRIGAVNTVVNREGELWGYNTDYTGFTRWAEHLGVKFPGRNVLVLGRGGAALAAAAAACDCGAAKVTLTGRDTDFSADSPGRDYDCIVNATPVGMFPDNFADSLLDVGEFPKLTHLLDCVYNPLRTRIVLDAWKKGIASDGGLYMLVSQAVAAASLFLDRKFDESLTDRIYLEILKEKQNIVLIGMPSCGKSTYGRKVAALQGREFFDTDEIIVVKEGKNISDIFSEHGEKYFRRIESEVIRELSSRQNCVIATGGGAVLSDENMSNLKMNGHIVYLYRDPSLLQTGEGRPLSKDKESLLSMFDVRNPIYLKWADEVLTEY